MRFDDVRDARGARRIFVEHLLTYASAQSDFGAAELAFDELLANVIRHAPGPVRIELEWLKNSPILHVSDCGPPFTPSVAQPPAALSEAGRGLFLVATLAGPLSVRRTPRGNVVSVALPVFRRT